MEPQGCLNTVLRGCSATWWPYPTPITPVRPPLLPPPRTTPPRATITMAAVIMSTMTESQHDVDAAFEAARLTFKACGMLETSTSRLPPTSPGHCGLIHNPQPRCDHQIARRVSEAVTRRIRRAQLTQQPPWRSSTLRPALIARRPDPRPGCAALGQPLDESAILNSHPGGRGKDPRWHERWGTWRSARAQRSASPKPAAYWPAWPAGTPTGPGASGCTSLPGPPY